MRCIVVSAALFGVAADGLAADGLAADGLAADPPAIPAETPADAMRRHEQVAERRKGTDIICHRGASEFAHKNTLEAFRATFELGSDGNEFDIRLTKDGVLVVFHDDMLDRLLSAYGDVSELSWDAL
jgi:glycerophosphoryl diester phosphodiesterase